MDSFILNTGSGTCEAYYAEDGIEMCLNVNADDGIMIDVYPNGMEGDGDPVSLSMSWAEWLHFTLEHGVR
jgi:hypothetical protein